VNHQEVLDDLALTCHRVEAYLNFSILIALKKQRPLYSQSDDVDFSSSIIIVERTNFQFSTFFLFVVRKIRESNATCHDNIDESSTTGAHEENPY
jgi:hypothetical protein